MSKSRWGSLGLAFLIVVGLILWMVSGEVKVAQQDAPEMQEPPAPERPRVEVETLQARLYEPGLLLQGQLEPWRSVTISAGVSGTVEELMVRQGERVEKGQPLLRLSDDGRRSDVERWQARIRKLEADLAAAQRLGSSNLVSQSEILGLESELAGARAELAQARTAIRDLIPEAPFDGVVNHRHVDLGNLVQPGTGMLDLVQVDRLKATGQIPQQSVSQVGVGQAVSIRLLDGASLEGEVSFVASAADPETRSFAVEVTVENPDLKRVAGGSATLRIALPETRATFVSPAYLSLGDDGRPGVRYVNENDEVVFRSVRLFNVTTDGAWVGGLPDEIRLITRGGGFVAIGQRVEPVDRDSNRG